MIVFVPLNRIEPNPWQTRLGDPDPAYVKELALDIAKNGLMQKPVGRLIDAEGPLFMPGDQLKEANIIAMKLHEGNGLRVQIAFGHNRLAAYRWLYDLRDNSDIPGDYSTMPVDLNPLTDEQMANYAWSENEKRRDVTPIERAKAIEKRMADFSWSQQQVAEHLGISRPVVSNSLRLLTLPDEIQQALAAGTISERVAVALLSLYDLPQALYDRAEKDYGIITKPSEIVKAALAGEITSDKIRERVNKLCIEYGRDLQKAEWGLDEIASSWTDISLLRSPACRNCDQRMKDRNICLDRKCFDERSKAHRIQYMKAASSASGIALMEDLEHDVQFASHGGQTLNDWNLRIKDHIERIVQSGCQNLRLHYDRATEREVGAPNRVSGYPNAEIICSKGTGRCTCVKAIEATVQVESGYDENRQWKRTETPTEFAEQLSAAPSADDLAEIAAAARRKKKEDQRLLKETADMVAERITGAVLANNSSAWRKIARAVNYKLEETGGTAYDVCLAIIRHIVSGQLSYAMLEANINRGYKDLSLLLKECGLEPLEEPAQEQPVGKTLVELFQEEQVNA